MVNFLYDMHTHSTNSDGEYSIKDLLKKAEVLGLKAIGITDHDTLGSLSDETFIKNNHHIKGILGVEFATDISNLHLVGYMKTWQNKTLRNFLLTQKEARENAAKRTVQLANNLGFDLDYSTLKEKYAKGASIGRPHIAKYLVDKKIVANVREAFDIYLKEGKPLYIAKKRINFKELIPKAKKEFNIIIGLAHPFFMNRPVSQIYKIIDEIIEYGIDGIEVHYAGHTEEQIKYLDKLCDEKHLLKLGGSDFHGEGVKPDVKLGAGGIFEKDFYKLVRRIELL